MEARLYHVIVKRLFFPKLDSSFTEKHVKTNQLFSFYIFPSLHFFFTYFPIIVLIFQQNKKTKKPTAHPSKSIL